MGIESKPFLRSNQFLFHFHLFQNFAVQINGLIRDLTSLRCRSFQKRTSLKVILRKNDYRPYFFSQGQNFSDPHKHFKFQANNRLLYISLKCIYFFWILKHYKYQFYVWTTNKDMKRTYNKASFFVLPYGTGPHAQFIIHANEKKKG